ncbi:hypothetical protein M5X11_12800 [Paenibacillus alginolyticus]|uniref:hypothetical protein n=1 Tax=Paenibacillus alginolyticus TaxID=59839 RepID=UPI000416CAC5|nr:hypothetical protein [Paenibacillus alginolyticus]MCY9665833.1 hypothetical protein [Paenibacillus alginolyticus]
MSMTATALKNKAQVIKEREGARVKRWLHILFGGRKFGFQWTNEPTSYTDGKDVYAKYDIVRPGGGTDFSEEEKRVIRKATSVHERGHIEYDIIEDFVSWVKEHSSPLRSDWEANSKYPGDWTKFYGNVMLDGRMENFTIIDHPEVDEYIQFKNYNWKCAPMTPQNRVQDFRLLYMTRSLGMIDPEGLHPDSLALIDSVQPTIEKARFEPTTKECLESALEIIRATWPMLMDWMEADGQSPAEPMFGFPSDADDPNVSWGDREEVEQNVLRVKIRIQVADSPEQSDSDSGDDEETNGSDSNGTAPEGEEGDEESFEAPDCSGALSAAAKEAEADEKEAEKELGPYGNIEIQIEIDPGLKRPSFSATATTTAYRAQNLYRYQLTERMMKRDIDLTSKVLKELCEPTPDELLMNQRSGKVLVNRMWRSEALGETNFFARKLIGTPGAEVRIAMMADISGSTGDPFRGTSSRVIDEIRKSLILMSAACEKASIPNAAYAFTEYDDTVIFPLKPYGRFGTTEKSFLGGIEDESGNRDTLALQYMINDMSKYKEGIRIVVMISDGMPCFERNEDENTMRLMVQQAEKHGIDVVCLYCGPERANIIKMVQHMYPGGAINVGKNLARDLSRHVKRIIRKRR